MNGSIGEQVSEAFEKIKNSFASTELIKAKADIAERDASITSLKAENTTLKSDLTQANAKILTLETEAKNAKEAAEKAKTEADAKVSEKETEVEKRAKIKAQEVLAGAGHNPVKEETKEPGTAASIDDLRRSLVTETDPLKRSAIAIQIRELRGHGELFKASEANSKN